MLAPALRPLAGLAPAGAVPLGNGIHGYRFVADQREVLVAWSNAAGVTVLDAEAASDDRAFALFDAMGEALSVTEKPLELTSEPLYIVINR